MKRIVDMREATGQAKSFAVWDTSNDRFDELDGYQDFNGLGDLLDCADQEFENKKMREVYVKRIESILPDWAK